MEEEEFFYDYIEKLKKNNELELFIAQTPSADIVGWSLFKVDTTANKAILEIICIDPTYWRQGIGKKLVFAVKEIHPEITHIAVVTRKINLMSPLFYEAMGFKKTSFYLPEYGPDEMQGYEWHAI